MNVVIHVYLHLGQKILGDENLNVIMADHLLEDYVTFRDSVQMIVLTFPTTVLISFILGAYLVLQGN